MAKKRKGKARPVKRVVKDQKPKPAERGGYNTRQAIAKG